MCRRVVRAEGGHMPCRVGKIGRYGYRTQASRRRCIEPRSSTAGHRRGPVAEQGAAAGGGDRARHRSDSIRSWPRLIFFMTTCVGFRRRSTLTRRSTPDLGGSVPRPSSPHSFLFRHISETCVPDTQYLCVMAINGYRMVFIVLCGVLWPHRTHNTA